MLLDKKDPYGHFNRLNGDKKNSECVGQLFAGVPFGSDEEEEEGGDEFDIFDDDPF